MEFMISMFGSEKTGRPRARRRIRISSETNSMRALPSNGEKDKMLTSQEIPAGNEANLPPEIEEGNVEYKLKLLNPSPDRLQHLMTQLKWRLREGQGEAIYEIGVEDCGLCTGLTDLEMAQSMSTLENMAKGLGASIKLLREVQVSPLLDQNDDADSSTDRRRVAEVLVRKVPDNQQFLELRIAVLGSVDAGKSTLLGVLTQGELDNGRGKARLNLFRHLHEVQSGRTSSISLDVLGFDSDGHVINYFDHSLEEVIEKSTKLITFIDLAGHRKMMNTVEALVKGPGCKKLPIRISTQDDVISAASCFDSQAFVPIFTVSNVSGSNLPLVQTFFNVLPPHGSSRIDQNELVHQATVLRIDDIFNVPNVGTVVCGLVNSGLIREADHLVCGPDTNGDFHTVVVDSLRRNRQPCLVVTAGQAVSVAVSFNTDNDQQLEQQPVLRKGMVLTSNEPPPVACTEFDADIYLLCHASSRVCVNFQSTVHMDNVCQTTTIVDMDRASLKPGERALVRLRFYRQPEFVTHGARLILREGRTKGMGTVVALRPVRNNRATKKRRPKD